MTDETNCPNLFADLIRLHPLPLVRVRAAFVQGRRRSLECAHGAQVVRSVKTALRDESA